MTSQVNDEQIADALKIFDDEFNAWHLLRGWDRPMEQWVMRRIPPMYLANFRPDVPVSDTEAYTDHPLRLPKAEADKYFDWHRRAEAMKKVLEWAFAL